ncbi:MAG: hypothetical protein JSR85_08465 [Proteobacteria bacterium]|nr:hypothetical protein [Pseudomonadota bacterium]
MAFAMMRGRATSELNKTDISHHLPLQRRPSVPELLPSQGVPGAITAAPIPIVPTGREDTERTGTPVLSFVAGSLGAMALEDLSQQSAPLVSLAVLPASPVLDHIPFDDVASKIQAIIEGRDVVIPSLPKIPPAKALADGEFSAYSRSRSSTKEETAAEPGLHFLISTEGTLFASGTSSGPRTLAPSELAGPFSLNEDRSETLTEETSLLRSRRESHLPPSLYGSIQEGDRPSRLRTDSELRDFVAVEFPEGSEDELEALALLQGRSDIDLAQAEQTLQSIEGRRCFRPWIYLDHMFEKIFYALTLRKGSPKGCCKSKPLWVEGQGIPLKSGFKVACAITAFRVGFEYMIFQPLALTLNALMDYQLYQQLAGHKDFNPIGIISIWWNGDEQSIRGALSVLVQNPENAPYFLAFFAMPLIWGIGNVVRILWNARNETPDTFGETTEAIGEFNHPRQGWWSGLWSDKIRWLFPFPKMDGDVGDLVYGLLLDGRLTIPQREAALEALIKFTRNATGYAKLSGLSGLQRVAVGTSLNQLDLVERTHGTAYKNTLLTEKFQALEELRSQNPGLWKAGFKGAIHNLYANYLRWAMGDFNGKANAAAWGLFKAAKLALQIYLYVEIVQQIIDYLKCPKPLQQGFNAAMQPSGGYSLYNQACFNAYLSIFNKVPGQPAQTLVSLMPNFKLDPSFTLFNLSGASATGEQVAALIMGLRTYQPTIHLTEFDLSGNTINTESGMAALMAALNATQQAAPPGGGVRYLNMSGNAIGELSDGPTLVLGQGLPSLPQLQILDFSENTIGNTAHKGTVAIGENLRFLPQLQTLDLSNNLIGKKGDNGTVAIGESIPSLTQLQMLGLSNNAIGKGIIAIGKGLRYLTLLQILDLSDNVIGFTADNGMIAIGENLQYLTRLKILNLSDNGMGFVEDKGIIAIGKGLRYLTQLQRLDLSGNGIEYTADHGTIAIGENLKYLTALQTLDLSLNKIGYTGDNGTVAIGESLPYLTQLQTLDFSQNFISAGFAKLVSSIVDLQSLKSLYVQQVKKAAASQLAALRKFWNQRNSDTDIYALRTSEDVHSYLNSLPNSTTAINLSGNFPDPSSEVVTLLFKGMARFSSLQTLNLSNNLIGGEKQTMAIGEGLQYLPQLQTLDLSGNGIDAVAIGEGLHYLSKLQVLDLSDNGIGLNTGNGTILIGEALQYLPRLKTLDLSNNMMTEGIIAIGKGLRYTSLLQILDLSNNMIGLFRDEGIIAIGEGLRFLSKLQTLKFSNNRMGNSNNGTTAIGNSLPFLTQLQTLDVSDNFIGRMGAQSILNALPPLICSNLQTVNLQGNNFTGISWGPAAQQLQGLYSAQIQQACEANRCFGTPVQVDTKAVQCSGIQPNPLLLSQRSLLAMGDSAAVVGKSADPNQNALVSYRPEIKETSLISYKKPSLPSVEGEEDIIDLRPSLLDLFTASVKRGAIMTIVPEVLNDLLRKGGVSRRTANVARSIAQLGMTFYMTSSYLPTLTGLGINLGLNSLGLDAPISSAIGNTAAVAVSLAQGAVITPTTLAISMGGSMAGSTLALAARNKVKSWMGEEEPIPHLHAQPHAQQKAHTTWAYIRENLILFVWANIILTLLLGDYFKGQR